jgi:hypothetical protein
MRSSHVCGLTLATSLIAFGLGLAGVPAASADPGDSDNAAPTPDPGPGTLATSAAPLPGDADATTTACKLFAAAMNYAASSYEDFAYSSAGSGDYVNYGDPSVVRSDLVGRSGLKDAAVAALTASTTPGLQPDISAPMQLWSMHAAQLYLVMTTQGGGDTLNAAATQLNTDGKNAQMACAAAGWHL